MMITPQPNIIQLRIDKAPAGVLDTSSKESAVECAEVIAVGSAVCDGKDGVHLKVGDRVFVKAWAIDIITHDDQRFYFVDQTSNGILAKLS